MAKWLKYRAWWLMALPLIAACGDDAPAVPAADEVRYSDVPIVPTASIVSAKLSRADFEGPVNGTTFTPSTTKIFGVTAYLGDTIPTEWSSNSRLNFSAVTTRVLMSSMSGNIIRSTTAPISTLSRR